MLAFVGAGAFFVFHSFASTAALPVGHPISPAENASIKQSGDTTGVQFVVSADGSKTGLLTQVYYRKVGSGKWTSFGLAPQGGNVDPRVEYNHVTNKYMTMDGYTCSMPFGTTAPANCQASWTNGKATGKPGFSGYKMYFPSVALAVGNYEWEVRSFDSTKNLVGNWSSVRKFSIVSKTSPAETIRKYDGKVALTFDDGPSYDSTTKICNILKNYNAEATFFFVGSRLDSAHSEAQVAMSCGEIGDHTWTHSASHPWNQYTYSDALSEINRTDDLIEKLTGQRTKIMRTMGLASNDAVKAAIKDAGDRYVGGILVGDYVGKPAVHNPALIEKNVEDLAGKNGSILILHQTNPSSIEALPSILDFYKKKNFKVVTVSELKGW